MNFLNKHIDIKHTLKVGQTETLYFPYDEPGRITKIESPCDCSSSGDEPSNKRIVVIYKVKPIPQHLKQMNKTQYAIRKEIKVYHIENGVEVVDSLVFTGTVKE